MKSENLNDFVDLRIKPNARAISERITGLYFNVCGGFESQKIYALNVWEKSKFVYFDNLKEARDFEQNLSNQQ